MTGTRSFPSPLPPPSASASNRGFQGGQPGSLSPHDALNPYALPPELVAYMRSDPNGRKFLNDLGTFNRLDSHAKADSWPASNQGHAGNNDAHHPLGGLASHARCDKQALGSPRQSTGWPGTIEPQAMLGPSTAASMHDHPFSPNTNADKGRRDAHLAARQPSSMAFPFPGHKMSGPTMSQKIVVAAPGSGLGSGEHGLLPLAPAPTERGPYHAGNVDGEGDCETDTCSGSPHASPLQSSSKSAQSQIESLMAFSGDPKAKAHYQGDIAVPHGQPLARHASEGTRPTALGSPELSLSHPEPLLNLFSPSTLTDQGTHGGLLQGFPSVPPPSSSLPPLALQDKVPLEPSEWQQVSRQVPNGKTIKLNWRARRPTEIGRPVTPDGFTCQGDPNSPYEVYVGSEKHRQKCRFLSTVMATTILSRFPDIYYLDRKDSPNEGILADFTNNYVIGHHELMPFDPVTVEFEGNLNALSANVHGAKYVWQSGMSFSPPILTFPCPALTFPFPDTHEY